MSPYKNAEALKVTAHWTFYQVHLKSTFAFRAASILHCTVSIRSWKHFSKILLRIDNVVSNSCFGFVGCTSLMWISRSATFQGCSAGWRSGDSWGYLSTMNSLTSSVIRLTRLHYLEACILWTYTLPSFFIFILQLHPQLTNGSLHSNQLVMKMKTLRTKAVQKSELCLL